MWIWAPGHRLIFITKKEHEEFVNAKPSDREELKRESQEFIEYIKMIQQSKGES